MIARQSKSARPDRATRETWTVRVLCWAAALLVCLPFIDAGAAPAPDAIRSSTPSAAATVIDLQPLRKAASIRIRDGRGGEGSATLTDLNPGIGAWHLLRIVWERGGTEVYHLENPDPLRQTLLLDVNFPTGIMLSLGDSRTACDLWKTGDPGSLGKARTSGSAYAPLCGGRLYLRNPARGYRTVIETTAEFLRDRIPGGERIETFIRDTIFAPGYREKARTAAGEMPVAGPAGTGAEVGPNPARLGAESLARVIDPSRLGIEIDQPPPKGLAPGRWYPAQGNPGVHVGVMTSGAVHPELLGSHRKAVNALDPGEKDALVYLIAFDVGMFELRFARGTDHPRLNWSDHMLARMRDASLPGPDGIATMAPLVSTGLISPADAPHTAAAFTGGFKRTHGAFTWGEMAVKNRGSHYGFLESGVIESTLQPGLATLYSLVSGRTEMKTWTESDRNLLPELVSARQNGVPLIAAFDPATGVSVPGPLVARWGEGNWSGSADRKLRTLRAGAALQESGGRRYLIYGVFTSATPSGMARVFQAYGCSYAMHLDMNALEHTYLALYRREGSSLFVQHLIRGMAEVDRTVQKRYLPRFLGYSDNRDFFYLLRRGGR